MNRVFDLLKNIESSPKMYVGETDGNRRLEDIEMIIIGYQIALHAYGLDESDRWFLRSFGRYVRSKSGWSMATGVVNAIVEHTRNSDEAWEMFWQLCDEFRVATNDDPSLLSER